MQATNLAILKNAKIILRDSVLHGALALEAGRIAAVEPVEPASGEALDCEGDYLLPGLIDLHTDNVEHHFFPRPSVRWPATLDVVLAHDWQMLGAGITTVLDSLAFGDYESGGARKAILQAAIECIDMAQAAGLLHTDHYLHFRCEVSDPAMLEIAEPNLDHPRLRLISIMDHTPGQRQWRDLAIYRAYRRQKRGQVWTDAEFEAHVVERRQVQEDYAVVFRAGLNQAARMRGLPLASHDDTTVADVEQSHAEGVTVSEFPTTIEAARHARRLGMKTVMGAPNIVLGGSHSGNVGAATLATEGLLDILASDYVPTSLLQAAFLLAERGTALPEAVAMVTANPAEAVGLKDRGRIEPGLRADLLRVGLVAGAPVIRGIWRQGRRII